MSGNAQTNPQDDKPLEISVPTARAQAAPCPCQLMLGGTQMTAKDVVHLEELTNLRSLPQTPTITPAILDALKKKLPQSSIRQGSF